METVWDNFPRIEKLVKLLLLLPMADPSQNVAQLLLTQVLRALRPLVGLLVRQGVHYPAVAAALKPLFLEAAQHELARHGKPATDSALSLMSGVHRRDVRTLTREHIARSATAPQSMSLSSEVVAQWMANPKLAPKARPKVLPRHGQTDSFDALVASVSRDVRPRAVLDEMLRLGVAQETDDGGVALRHDGFAPRQALADMAAALADNLHDHAAAAAANLDGGRNFLEQAVYADELSDASVEALRLAARQAWQSAFEAVLAKAQQRCDHDARHAEPAERQRRMRFGVYFYSDTPEEPTPKDHAP
jgi:Family of unknown function (DUF6502)